MKRLINSKKTAKNHINVVGEEIKEKIKQRIDDLENKINKLLVKTKTCEESREELKKSYAHKLSE